MNKEKKLYLIISALILVVIGLSVVSFYYFIKTSNFDVGIKEPEPIVFDLVELKNDNVELKSYPDENADTKTFIEKGRIIEIIELGYDWVKVRCLGQTGYVEIKNLDLANVEKKVTTVSLPMRRSPNTGDVVHVIKPNSVIQVTEEIGEWIKIIYNNKTGYVSIHYLEDYVINSQVKKIFEKFN